jgi:hypothetical protein
MKRFDLKIGLLAGLFLAVCAFTLTAPSRGQVKSIDSPISTTRPADPLAGIDFARVVIWIECAGVDRSTPRGFDSQLIEGGWSKWFASTVQPEIDWLKSRGVKRPRLIFHNPYGVEPRGTNYAFTQRQLCAADARTRHLSQGLEAELRRLTDAGVESITYFGSFKGDASTATSLRPGWQSATIGAWTYAIAEALDGGASLAFDDTGDIVASSPEFAFIRQCGAWTKIYFEPRFQKTHAHLFGQAVIAGDSFFIRSDPALYADSSRWAAPNAKLGEVIRHLTFPDGEGGWTDRAKGDVANRLANGARRVQADGHTVAVAAGWWRNLR